MCVCLGTKSGPTLLQPHGLLPARLLCPWDFLGKNTEVGCHFFFQVGFPIQRSNLSFFHWKVDSLPMSHQEASVEHTSSCLENPMDWRSLQGCSPWGRWGSDTTERLHFYFSLSCIGEGNGNPCQCSCLENPKDRGAWLAAVYGVAQSWTRLKRLSSSSSSPWRAAFCF